MANNARSIIGPSRSMEGQATRWGCLRGVTNVQRNDFTNSRRGRGQFRGSGYRSTMRSNVGSAGGNCIARGVFYSLFVLLSRSSKEGYNASCTRRYARNCRRIRRQGNGNRAKSNRNSRAVASRGAICSIVRKDRYRSSGNEGKVFCR